MRCTNLFNERLADLLIDRGRMLMGWDEIAHGDLPRTSIVQSWRGGASRDRAVAQGFDCVFSAGYYLDFFYPADLHYAYDPESPSEELLRLDERVRADPRLAHVRDGLGWASEFAGRSAVDAPSGELAAGPRARRRSVHVGRDRQRRDCSRGASGAACRRSPNGCGRRARCATKRTCICGCRRLRPLLAAYADVDIDARQAANRSSASASARRSSRQLRDLFDAIEPIKWYSRLLGAAALRARVAGSTEQVERPYTVATPLDRVADFIEPASEWIPRFNAAVRAAIDGCGRRGATSRCSKRPRRGGVVSATSCVAIGERVPAIAELDAISAQLARLAT